MDDIKAWLDDRDYEQGVNLYLKHGQDPVLKKLFTAEMETAYKRQRLERALRDILSGNQVIKPAENPLATISIKAWPVEAAKDDVLRALRADWLRKFKEMQDLRSQLMLMANDQIRGEAAHRILQLDDECDEIYQKRDYYIEHGKLPEEKHEEYIVDPIQAAARMETLRKYLRRERLNLEKDPANVGAATRRAKFIKEYNHYASRFGRPQIKEGPDAVQKTED